MSLVSQNRRPGQIPIGANMKESERDTYPNGRRHLVHIDEISVVTIIKDDLMRQFWIVAGQGAAQIGNLGQFRVGGNNQVNK